MCPDLVKAAQRIAAASPMVTAHVYDIQHFEELKNRYHVMSVPCMVIDDADVYFGRKMLIFACGVIFVRVIKLPLIQSRSPLHTLLVPL
jgi:alkyl hydroperoxide reductase subunit AhpF